ncbi:MAG: hypothetical protein IKS34_05165 [Clostridia bacterium]|nr:hypothetical protein [Clostridia bacterium]
MIQSAADLKALSDLMNGSKDPGFKAGETAFALTNEIDLSTVCGGEKGDWIPIGKVSNDMTIDRSFSYVLDGRGHTISNLRIENASRQFQGLFAALGAGAVIRNLTMDETCVISSSDDAVGSLAGQISKGSGTVTIENCGFRAAVTGKNGVGGIFGRLNQSGIHLLVSNCYVAGDVHANGTGKTVSPFGIYNFGSASYAHCFYLEGCATGIKDPEIPSTGVSSRTLAQFASGQVAYELGDAWGQSLPGERWPVLGSLKVHLDAGAGTYFNYNRIRGASIAIGTDLSAYFYCYIDDDHAGNAKMRFTWNGSTSTVTGELKKSTETEQSKRYVFKFDKICPQCMLDPLTAELIDTGSGNAQVMDVKENFTVAEYCTLRLNASTNDREMTLLADLMEYGSAAQLYAQYKTETLAKNDAAYVAAKTQRQVSASSSNLGVKEKTLSGGATAAGTKLKYVTMYYDYCIRIGLHFIVQDAGDVTITETRGSRIIQYAMTDPDAVTLLQSNEYRLLTAPVSVSELGTDSVFELKINGQTTQTLTYSPYHWCYTVGKEGSGADETAKGLALATYRYGESARIYISSLTS